MLLITHYVKDSIRSVVLSMEKIKRRQPKEEMMKIDTKIYPGNYMHR